MPDPFQPVFAGSPKSAMSARTFNGLARAGQAHARSKFGDGGEGQNSSPLVPACECQVQNLTGADLPQGSILVAIAAVVNPAVHPLAAQESPTFTVAAVADVTLPFVVTAEPIPNNAIGDAVVSGLAVCTVIISDATHTRAVPVVATTTHLVSAASGGVPLWWTPGGTGTKVCLVGVGMGGHDPDASTTVRGYVSTGTQSYAGLKTFTSGAVIYQNSLLFTGFSNDTSLSLVDVSGTRYFVVDNVTGGLSATRFGIWNGSTITPGLTTTFLTGDGRTATFTGGILTGLA